MLLATALIVLAIAAADAVARSVNGIHYMQGAQPRDVAVARRQAAKLQYYSGLVISSVEVHPIYYGAKVAFTSDLDKFYAGVANSSFLSWLSEYNTPTQTIGSGSAVPGISVNPGGKTALDDKADIQPYLVSLVKSGVITPTSNTFYPIHFDPKYSITLGSDSSCVIFCAYHGTIDISSISSVQYLYYGIMPDQGGSCAGGCGSNPSTVNNLFSVSSHELVEAITDPAVGVASVVGPPLAWYDPNNGEIGDICNGVQGTTVGADGVTYVVQTMWSNSQGKCTTSGSGIPPPPPLSVSSTSAGPAVTSSKATSTKKHRSHTPKVTRTH